MGNAGKQVEVLRVSLSNAVSAPTAGRQRQPTARADRCRACQPFPKQQAESSEMPVASSLTGLAPGRPFGDYIRRTDPSTPTRRALMATGDQDLRLIRSHLVIVRTSVARPTSEWPDGTRCAAPSERVERQARHSATDARGIPCFRQRLALLAAFPNEFRPARMPPLAHSRGSPAAMEA
jgi:hypothetical protein